MNTIPNALSLHDWNGNKPRAGSLQDPDLLPPSNDPPSMILDGCYHRGAFQFVELRYATLSGDFSGANFSGAALKCCKLAGNFSNTYGLGMAMQCSEILPPATFHDAALYGCKNIFFGPAQIRGARMHANDRVDVAMGTTVTVNGERYELCIPAQTLPDVRVYALEPPFDLRRVSQPPAGSGFSSRPLIYDVRGLRELRWVSYVPKYLTLNPHLQRDLHVDLRLLAAGITLRGIKRSAQQSPVYLTGEFNRAACKNCKIHRLHLVAGAFREFDLHDSVITHLQLDLDRVDAEGLVLPEQLSSARCTWHIGGSLYYFEARPEYLPAVMSVWHSPHHCYGLANQIINHGDASVRDAGKRILKFTGTTMAGVLGPAAVVQRDIATVAALILRRNQLRKLRPDAAYLSSVGLAGRTRVQAPPSPAEIPNLLKMKQSELAFQVVSPRDPAQVSNNCHNQK